MKLDFDVVIIGAGVAGMSAALYLKRANITCCILEKEIPGGQINRTSTIENYPGIKNITGPELADNMLRQTQEIGVIHRYGNVEKIENYDDYKKVITAKDIFTCKYVIIATGRRPKKLGIPNEEELSNRGISWCAICDGPLYKGKNVCVIGGGDSAVEETLYLANICNHVTLINRSDQLRAQEHLKDGLKEKKNITVLYETIPLAFVEKENKLVALMIEDKTDKNKMEIPCDGSFIYIGQTPNTEFVKDLNILDENGYILTDNHQETTIKNIFAIGDVIKKNLYQIVTATAEGAIAATSIVNRR